MTCTETGHSGFKENPYFSREEFACKCGCGYKVVDHELLDLLTNLRAYFEVPIYITSGARCFDHNRAVGGSAPKLDLDHEPISGTGSQHLWGKAADIVVKDMSPREVYVFLDKLLDGYAGLGLYKDFVHVDVRDKKARWKDSSIVSLEP